MCVYMRQNSNQLLAGDIKGGGQPITTSFVLSLLPSSEIYPHQETIMSKLFVVLGLLCVLQVNKRNILVLQVENN